jgi:TM2 domain-containing membrane protein YozV
MDEVQVSNEKKFTMVFLCYFFGCFGLHRFYTGKLLSGILMLLTLGGLGIWMLIDLALIIMGKFNDKEGRAIVDWI